MTFNLPILLTWLRIVMIPLFVGVFYFEQGWIAHSTQNLVATVIFTGAAITDWLDGWLARRLNQTSAFGAFLDPVADKLMVAAALIILVQLGRVDAAIALIIIGREIAISALREWMTSIGQGRSVAVSMVGKIKTALFGGEGLFFAVLRGPGTVWLQSLPFSRLASRIFAAAPQTGGGGREQGSVLAGLGAGGLLGGVLGGGDDD